MIASQCLSSKTRSPAEVVFDPCACALLVRKGLFAQAAQTVNDARSLTNATIAMFVRVLPRPASAAIFALLTGSAGKTEQARLTEAEWARHALQELVVQTSSHGLRERDVDDLISSSGLKPRGPSWAGF